MPKRSRAIDEAKDYRARVVKEITEKAPQWQMPGLRRSPNERTVFTQLLPGETAARLRRQFSAYLKPYWGRGLAGFGYYPGCILRLPSGETMIAVTFTRFPATMHEQDCDFSGHLVRSDELLHAFASETKRLLGEIQDGAAQLTLLCSDGRRFAIASCESRPLSARD